MINVQEFFFFIFTRLEKSEHACVCGREESCTLELSTTAITIRVHYHMILRTFPTRLSPYVTELPGKWTRNLKYSSRKCVSLSRVAILSRIRTCNIYKSMYSCDSGKARVDDTRGEVFFLSKSSVLGTSTGARARMYYANDYCRIQVYWRQSQRVRAYPALGG